MRRLILAVLLIGCQQARPEEKAAASSPPSGLSRRDELVLAAANVALPPPGFAASDLPDPSSLGATLVASYCTQCHNMPTPQMHSATDWPSVARRMWLRMDLLPAPLGVKVPTLADRFTLLNYFTSDGGP